jgi:predicted nucleic-acid-binding Zn-ribbon protein
MFMWKTLTSLVLVASAFLFYKAPKNNEIKQVSDLRNLCWLVESAEGYGSSVMKTRRMKDGNYEHFLWTAAHVITSNKSVNLRIDPETGLPKVYVKFSDVSANRFLVQNGKTVGYTSYYAKVLRYSHKNDLCLLQLYKKNLTHDSVIFSTKPLEPGKDVLHIGSMGGIEAPMSLSFGKSSLIGMWRHDELYDQFMIPSIKGCSGGPIFNKENNECVGLLVEGTFGESKSLSTVSSFAKPSRIIRKFAKEANCLWAVDNVPIPNNYEEVKSFDPIDFGKIRIK